MDLKASVLAGLLVLGVAQPVKAQETPQDVAQCQSCHGPHGDSTEPNVPRLNGQTAEYLAARLKSFRDPTKQSLNAIHAMWDISNHIGDGEIPGLAQYYATQIPTALDRKRGMLAARGERLYTRGAQGVPGCSTCHGAGGEGNGLSPRLAGQHGRYLDYQLTAFLVTMRYHPAMDKNTMNLSNEDIRALVAYLAKD